MAAGAFSEKMIRTAEHAMLPCPFPIPEKLLIQHVGAFCCFYKRKLQLHPGIFHFAYQRPVDSFLIPAYIYTMNAVLIRQPNTKTGIEGKCIVRIIPMLPTAPRPVELLPNKYAQQAAYEQQDDDGKPEE